MGNAITSDSSTKETHAEIRRQCRAIAKAAGCKVSVTKSKRGGHSVYVTITASERNHLCEIYRAFEKANPPVGMYDFANPRDVAFNRMHLADWAIELLAKLNSVVDSYNSHMTDYYPVNFYEHVDFCSNVDKTAEAEIDAQLEAAAEATDSDNDVDNVVALPVACKAASLEDMSIAELRETLEAEKARRAELEAEIVRSQLIAEIEAERQCAGGQRDDHKPRQPHATDDAHTRRHCWAAVVVEAILGGRRLVRDVDDREHVEVEGGDERVVTEHVDRVCAVEVCLRDEAASDARRARQRDVDDREGI